MHSLPHHTSKSPLMEDQNLPDHTSQPPSMEDQNHCTTSDQDLQNLNLPKVLLHGPPGFSSVLQPPYSQKFHLLNHSSLPLHQFAATHPHHCANVAAVLCDGGYSLTANMLSLLPSLRLVVTASAGTDHVDLDECCRRGIQVASAGNLFSEDVADLAVALLIDVVMKISSVDRSLRKRHVDSQAITLASKVTGKRVGIVGLGRIGLDVAHRLEALECMVSYNSRKQKPFVPYPFYSTVLELATNTNVLVLCCSLNDQTRHMINREVMLALGKGGVIVNVGRGALIDEKQLINCLMEGEIGGAGLDVFENEPLVDEHFFSLDNVVLSPHAGFSTLESYLAICQLLGRNLEAFFSNNPLITPVI